MNEILVKIRFLLPTLPRAEKAIAGALAEHPEAVTYMTLAEIAKESGSSEASVIRFCKRMGYSGYSALQRDMGLALAEDSVSQTEELRVYDSDNMSEIMKKVYQSNVQTLTDTMALAGEQCEKALEALPEVARADVSHEKGTAVVTLQAEVADDVLKKAVEEKDYEVVSVQ